MSGRTESHYVLNCDGCGAAFGESGEHPTAVECRAAAYAAGWRMPPRISKTTGRRVSLPHDVCPNCVETFDPETVAKAAS